MRVRHSSVSTALWTALALGATTAAHAEQAASSADLAARFGAQPAVMAPELSPDGKHIVYVGPGAGAGHDNYAYVVDIAARKITGIVHADGNPFRLARCNWSTSDRLVCLQYGQAKLEQRTLNFSRLFAIDIDGRNPLALGLPPASNELYHRGSDGDVIDWLGGSDSQVLMIREYIPQVGTGKITAQTDEGSSLELVDTRTGKATRLERPKLRVWYVSDGRGNARIMSRAVEGGDGYLTPRTQLYYRKQGEQDWLELGSFTESSTGRATGMFPLAIDPELNAAYVLNDLDGRRALYRVMLDGSLKSELVFGHPSVDISDVVTIGRNGRVIGAAYETDRPHVEYFDRAYRALARSLSSAMPRLPLIDFVSASADEKQLLVLAAGDTDPGRYFLLDRTSNQMREVLTPRPELIGTTLANVKSVSYAAADGTQVPAYLTLPPGKEAATGLPAIVMPHGGPQARDTWGFDWLAQFYATSGFAVLQPNYRGSEGYGNNWFQRNGFQGWKTAIGDVVDGGRWLVKQGIADPAKLAIVGWSYGGYAALQASALDADLFRAVVATAPVTDLQMLRFNAVGFTDERVLRDFVGTGPTAAEGSPTHHAGEFKAPVLMFHGDMDANVDLAHSQAMDKALKRAGKRSELVVYPKLDHQLNDSAVRADMLRRSYEFLRASLKL